MITLQARKSEAEQNRLHVKRTRSEFAIGHQPHRTGTGAHRSRAEKRTGRRVERERAIREYA